MPLTSYCPCLPLWLDTCLLPLHLCRDWDKWTHLGRCLSGFSLGSCRGWKHRHHHFCAIPRKDCYTCLHRDTRSSPLTCLLPPAASAWRTLLTCHHLPPYCTGTACTWIYLLGLGCLSLCDTTSAAWLGLTTACHCLPASPACLQDCMHLLPLPLLPLEDTYQEDRHYLCRYRLLPHLPHCYRTTRLLHCATT